MSEEKKNRNNFSIGRKGFYKVCNWMHQNAERLLGEKPHYTEAARQCGKALDLGENLPVTVIMDAIEATGINWNPVVQVGGRAHQTYKQLADEFREEVSGLRELNVALANQLKDAIDRVGLLESTLHDLEQKYRSDLAIIRGHFAYLFEELKVLPPKGSTLAVNASARTPVASREQAPGNK